MFARWRKVARMPLGVLTWKDEVAMVLPDQVVEDMPKLDLPGGTPVAQAAHVLAQTLQVFPRQEAAALMLADVALARALGWGRPVPLLAAHLRRVDLRAIAGGASDASLRVHHAMIAACDAAIRVAADLGRRAARLDAATPRLRAKGAGSAVALFRSHDAVSPAGMLSPVIMGTTVAMSDRAARRLCDRLVDLGAVRELTGRASFRLYGL